MSRTLHDFLVRLEHAGELRRVREPVSPILEIAAAADAESRRPAPRASVHARAFDPDHAELGGRALLFERVDGCDLPLAINVFGSYRRMEMALRCEAGGFEAIAARIGALVKPVPPRSLGELIAAARRFAPLVRIPPRTVRRGACQEVVRRTERGEVDLRRLPIIKCWPHDGDPAAVGWPMDATAAGTAEGQGRFVTFAGMHTIHADDRDAARPASHNIGMYRSQLVDATHLAMHWHLHHDGAAHWRSWKALGRPMPIAICFGGETVLPYAATAPLPPGISELLMAGFLNRSGIPMVRGVTVPVRVPANAELVIEGWVRTDAGPPGWEPSSGETLGPGAVLEGPFGDHTGFYSLPDRYPLVEVTAVTHRREAVFPATVVGLPPQEDYYLGKATERLFLPLLRTLVHDIEDYHLPMFGAFHNCAFVRIRKAYAFQARRVMHAIWGAGQMAWTKTIVVVDETVDVHDERAVLRAVMERCRFDRDVELVRGPLDILDHAAPFLGAGHKIGFDATTRLPGEAVDGVPIDAPIERPGADAMRRRLAGAVGTARLVRVAVPEFGLGRLVIAAVDKQAAGDGAHAIDAIRAASGRGADFVVAIDAAHDPEDWERALFVWCANSDPGRDLHRAGAAIAFDATTKVPGDERGGWPVRPYPAMLA